MSETHTIQQSQSVITGMNNNGVPLTEQNRFTISASAINDSDTPSMPVDPLLPNDAAQGPEAGKKVEEEGEMDVSALGISTQKQDEDNILETTETIPMQKEKEHASGKRTTPSVKYDQYEEEEDTDIDNFEIVCSEFFAHTNEPSFTVNVDKVSPNAACVRILPEAKYVQIMVSQEVKKLLLKPCTESDNNCYCWVKEKNGRRYSRHRTGEEFVLMLCELMNWNPDYRYKILGRKVRADGVPALLFDLKTHECFEKAVTENGKRRTRRAMIVENKGRFGPTYAESKRSLDVNTFDKYTVITVNGTKRKPKIEQSQGVEQTQEKIEAMRYDHEEQRQ